MRFFCVISGVLISLLLVSCSSNNDRALKPEPLQKLNEKLQYTFFWSVNIGDGVGDTSQNTQHFVDEQAVYACDHEGIVSALDKSNGKVLWSVALEKPLGSGPAVDNGMVVVGALDGSVTALDIRDGKKIWASQVSSEVLVAPLIVAGKVVVRTGDGRLFAFKEATGELLWVYDRTSPSLALRGTSRPAFGKGHIVAGFDTGRLAVINIDEGLPLWERIVGISQGRSDVERLSDIDADPIIDNGTIFVAAYQDRFMALELSSGRPLWEREISSYITPALDNGLLFVVNERHEVWAFSASNGATRWRQKALTGRRLTQPVVVGDLICVGDFEGYVHCLDRETGEQKGRFDSGLGEIRSSPVFDGHLLIVMGVDGRMSAIKIN